MGGTEGQKQEEHESKAKQSKTVLQQKGMCNNDPENRAENLYHQICFIQIWP